jgi:hypothetical protein
MNQRNDIPLAHRTEKRRMHSDELHRDTPAGAYIIEVPNAGTFLSKMLPYCAPCFGDSAIFYAIVDDFGDLIAVK